MCAPETTAASVKSVNKDAIGEDKLDKGDRRCGNEDLKNGVMYGTASLAFLFVAITVSFPHTQSQRDSLGCDSMCVGSMTSTRSMLTLTGSTLVGKLSDSTRLHNLGGSRRMCLVVGILASTASLLIGYNATTMQMLWASMIPGALLQHNANIFKALFSSYHDAVPEKSSSTDRAHSAGLLGMGVGIALMVGPLAGASLFSTYRQATLFGGVCVAIAMALIFMMPTPSAAQKKTATTKSGIFSSFDIPSARTPAAIFLMVVRVCMALAFHIFQTIWTSSLKERFEFGPKEYGSFFSFIGLTYALSQGVLAKMLLKIFNGHTARGRVGLLLASCVCLGCGRYFAFQTNSLPVVYALFAGIVTALGLVNSMFSADVSKIAPPDEIGALIGVLAAVESAAGMAGPLAGGALSYIDPIKAPLYTVLALYVVVFVMVFFGYEALVLKNSDDFQRKKKDAEKKEN